MDISRIKCFTPIVDECSRIIILGSMPGEESLKREQYYGHPRNQFWKIIFSIYNQAVPEDYISKISFLRDKKIALWDVIEFCYRKGSLDSDIKQEEANDFNHLFKKYPNIRNIMFNGTKAYDVFRKKIGFTLFNHIDYFKLPSTSPANAVAFDKKLVEWMIIRHYLE